MALAISQAAAQAVKDAAEGSHAQETCIAAALLAAACCAGTMTEKDIEEELRRAPISSGPPFPWEWASLSDGSVVSTDWGAARKPPPGQLSIHERRRRAIERYAVAHALTVDWQYGRKRWELRELQLRWAQEAACMAARTLGCEPPMLSGRELPWKPKESHQAVLTWNERNEAYERAELPTRPRMPHQAERR